MTAHRHVAGRWCRMVMRRGDKDRTPSKGGGHKSGGGDGWPLDKSLCLIPELFRIALVYGFNPLTGRTTPRWRARNVVRWCRPNPPVGALADKVRPATSDMVVACMSRRRYFDLDAIRGPGSPNTHARTARGVTTRPNSGKAADDEARGGNFSTLDVIHDTNGAPPLDHWWHDEDMFDQDAWLISTEPYKGSHYATWPTELCVKPIKAMCPRLVCTVCGKPSERIVESSYVDANGKPASGVSWDSGMAEGKGAHSLKTVTRTTTTTIGWTCCGCGEGCRPTTWERRIAPVLDDEGNPLLTKAGKPKVKRQLVVGDVGHCRDKRHWRPGIVLDPFAGSGTTGAVATGHGRNALLIDLDARNADLAAQRVGMWLTVEHFDAEAAS